MFNFVSFSNLNHKKQFIAFASLINKETLSLGDYIYPEWSVNVGWLITLSSLSCIPLYAIYHIIHKREKFWKIIVKSFGLSSGAETTVVEITNFDDDDGDDELNNRKQPQQQQLNDNLGDSV